MLINKNMSPLSAGHCRIFWSERFLGQDFGKDSDENYRNKSCFN